MTWLIWSINTYTYMHGAIIKVASMHRSSTDDLFASGFQLCCSTVTGSQTTAQYVVSVESSTLLFHGIKQ